jgi:Xaa-Pro aminopeptidase
MGHAIPFDAHRLDGLMEQAGIDVFLATSKHNTQYLLGGYRFIFFAAMDAIGHSRYLPIVIYEKGRPEHAAFVANKMEGGEHQNHPFWTPAFYPESWGSLDAAARAAEHLKSIGKSEVRIGIEPPFLPSDAHKLLSGRLPGATLVDATDMMERMRALKTPHELSQLRQASELITEAMMATIGWARAGSTKADIIERLRREETNRGLHFEYCLLTLGACHNRASSDQAWKEGRYCRSTPAATIAAISAISAAWACSESRTRNWRTCWRASMPCSRRRSRRSGRVLGAAT